MLGREHRALCRIASFLSLSHSLSLSAGQSPRQVLFLPVTPSCLSAGTLGKLCAAEPHPSPSRTDSSQLSYLPPSVYPIPAHCVTAQTLTHFCSKQYPSNLVYSILLYHDLLFSVYTPAPSRSLLDWTRALLLHKSLHLWEGNVQRLLLGWQESLTLDLISWLIFYMPPAQKDMVECFMSITPPLGSISPIPLFLAPTSHFVLLKNSTSNFIWNIHTKPYATKNHVQETHDIKSAFRGPG